MPQLIIATPEAVIAALKNPSGDGRIVIAGSRVKSTDTAARALMPVVPSKRRSRKDETNAEPKARKPRKARGRADEESDTPRRRGRAPAPLNLSDTLKTTGYVLKVLDSSHLPHYYNREMGTWDIVKTDGALFQIPVVEVHKITGQELLSRLAA